MARNQMTLLSFTVVQSVFSLDRLRAQTVQSKERELDKPNGAKSQLVVVQGRLLFRPLWRVPVDMIRHPSLEQ